jgi:hypothetical protein
VCLFLPRTQCVLHVSGSSREAFLDASCVAYVCSHLPATKAFYLARFWVAVAVDLALLGLRAASAALQTPPSCEGRAEPVEFHQRTAETADVKIAPQSPIECSCPRRKVGIVWQVTQRPIALHSCCMLCAHAFAAVNRLQNCACIHHRPLL